MRGTLTSVCEAVLMAITADTSTFSSFAATTTASLGDFDNLQPYQLNLGAAVLQHLLSCGQHLILDNDITIGREAKCPFHQSPRVFFIAHSTQEEHICKQHTDLTAATHLSQQQLAKGAVTALLVHLLSIYEREQVAEKKVSEKNKHAQIRRRRRRRHDFANHSPWGDAPAPHR